MEINEITRRSAHGRALADLKLVTVADGPGTGGRLLQLRTPAGLAADIALDRGGDLLRLSWKGREVGWHSAAMAPHPSPNTDAEHGLGFLRGFDGFIVTCGLDHHGLPAETSADDACYPPRDVHVHPLHGRISTARADLVTKEIDWQAGEIVIRLVIRQTSVFGENLELQRDYRFALEQGDIILTDRVTNRGFRPARHGILYHVNVGFPVLCETARLTGEHWELAKLMEMGALPKDDHVENVDVAPSPPDGQIGLRGGGVDLSLRYDPSCLPVTALWRAFQSGTYALGLEPQTDLSDKSTALLAAGEERGYRLHISVQDTQEDVLP